MDQITNEVFKALGYLFISGIVYFAYKNAYDEAKKNGLKIIL